MKQRHRQHVNPLKMTCLVPRENPIGVPLDRPVEVELGCGDAQFLIQRANTYPGRFFIGLDIRKEFLHVGHQEILTLGLMNISLETSNFIVDFDRLFPQKSIHRFYINFPDPWFKRRHQNRRWLTPETLSHLVQYLTTPGEIFFQSDVWTLSIDALSLLEGNADLVNTVGEWSFLQENPFLVRSSREIACMEEGKKIWRMLFARKSPYPEISQ